MNAEQDKDQVKGSGRWVLLGVVLLLCGIMVAMLWPTKADTTQPPVTGPTQNDTVTVPSVSSTETIPVTTAPPEQQLICADYGLFSGAFVEDGTDHPVDNVAALLVTNGSDQYLDLAKLTYELDGEEAVFMVTGLPAGTSAWVLESTGKTASADTDFEHVDTITSFRKGAVNTLEGVDLEFNGTMLKATNTTDKTFRSLTIYYKVLHEDGNYMGGITYMVNFGDLEPGQAAEKIAGHFKPEKTQIVRIGYQE